MTLPATRPLFSYRVVCACPYRFAMRCLSVANRCMFYMLCVPRMRCFAFALGMLCTRHVVPHLRGQDKTQLSLLPSLRTPGCLLALQDNPAAFAFFFDTSGRRSCYVAPERFYNPATSKQVRHTRLVALEQSSSHRMCSESCGPVLLRGRGHRVPVGVVVVVDVRARGAGGEGEEEVLCRIATLVKGHGAPTTIASSCCARDWRQ